LRVKRGTEERDELRAALIRSAEAALHRIDQLEAEGRIDAAHAEDLRGQFEHKRDLQRAADDQPALDHAARHRDVEREIIDAQRKAIIEMRDTGEIDNVVLRQVQADLDLASSRRALNE
jgi:CPA1 family monovalent cation:H+ antiporter